MDYRIQQSSRTIHKLLWLLEFSFYKFWNHSWTASIKYSIWKPIPSKPSQNTAKCSWPTQDHPRPYAERSQKTNSVWRLWRRKSRDSTSAADCRPRRAVWPRRNCTPYSPECPGSKSSYTKLTGKEERIRSLLDKNISKSAIGRILGVNRLTVTKFINDGKMKTATH